MQSSSDLESQDKILPIITKVDIFGSKGRKLKANILLDTASTTSYITAAAAEKLALPKKFEKVVLNMTSRFAINL